MKVESKILSPEDAGRLVVCWKESGHDVIFTNGCFDILHAGHVDYLQKAKNLGGKLIIGVNTDESVSRIKGEKRPIVEEVARMKVLAALEFVDCVTWFNEDTPLDLITFLMPDILVKGDDYNIENIVGADVVMKNGGRVDTISFLEGFSTSGIIKKIIELNKK